MKSLANRDMRVVTAEEVCETAAERFREQYEGESGRWKFADGKTLASVKKALSSCKHTPENICRILNDSWSHPQCYACGKRVERVVEIKENWGDEVLALCAKCLTTAAKLIK